MKSGSPSSTTTSVASMTIGHHPRPLTEGAKARVLVGALPSPQEHAGYGDHRPPRPHRTIPFHCAPCKAPCPTCGKLGRRKAIHHRRVRTIAYKQVAFLDVTYGEYRARCGCCTTFRTTPPGIEPRALYDNK